MEANMDTNRENMNSKTTHTERRLMLDHLADSIAQLKRDGFDDLSATRLCRIVESLIEVVREQEEAR
jgi:hypothetical protein